MWEHTLLSKFDKAWLSTMWEHILLSKFIKRVFIHNVKTHFVGEILQKCVCPQCEKTFCWGNSAKVCLSTMWENICWGNSSKVCLSTMWENIVLGKFITSLSGYNVRAHFVGNIPTKACSPQCESKCFPGKMEEADFNSFDIFSIMKTLRIANTK